LFSSIRIGLPCSTSTAEAENREFSLTELDGADGRLTVTAIDTLTAIDVEITLLDLYPQVVPTG
jgi:hypothetical protein